MRDFVLKNAILERSTVTGAYRTKQHWRTLVDNGHTWKNIMAPVVANAESYSDLGSSQQCEHANMEVALRVPKSLHYGSSESLDFRVKATAACINVGRDYICQVCIYSSEMFLLLLLNWWKGKKLMKGYIFFHCSSLIQTHIRQKYFMIINIKTGCWYTFDFTVSNFHYSFVYWH